MECFLWRKMFFGVERKALKGQIWQVPYLVAYWFRRGQDCFSDYLGNYFSDYFRTISGLFFGLFRTMRNNVYLRRDRK